MLGGARTISTWLLLAWVALPGCVQAEEFAVVRHGWHSGIVVRRADIPRGAWPPGAAGREFAGCRYLELGWGDRAFYTAPHPTVPMALRAALVPGPSVLHVAGFAVPPARAHLWVEVVTVPCTRAEFVSLCRALGTSFARDSAGRAEPLGAGLYGLKSRFYAATGHYWIGDTCNSWTLRAARAGGLPTRLGPAGTLSSAAVTAQVRRLRRNFPSSSAAF